MDNFGRKLGKKTKKLDILIASFPCVHGVCGSFVKIVLACLCSLFLVKQIIVKYDNFILLKAL